ncbi:isochorismate synthase [Sanguibacter gelidistatuariae]|uniref:isochorismate synthase n=1 Tax=Sanguibacter gelidistatuariae TaxID=1814289 RepID=A0A1G6X362_9MICO|nr:isochorismate synthase [Sanguibacter gelidistatuariae]SDD71716.1 isochorismate synthase [Sanguibacter gelidistatuariae]
MSSQPAAPSDSPQPRPTALVVRTTALDGILDSDAAALLRLLPPTGPLAWVRRGDGLVAWGEVARIETGGASRFAEAEAAWATMRAHAIVRDDITLPGTGPVAFGSFAFDESSAAGGVLIVPRVVVGRRGDRSWITTITTSDAVPTLSPVPSLADVVARAGGTTPITSPGAVTYVPGAVSDADWIDAVDEAVERIRAGRLDKVVMARDVVAHTTEPIDPRWLLTRLADSYTGCWTFSVDGMVGATPELLVRSEKGLVTSRVLAGTIRRTGGEEADVARAAVLAHSSKDLEEHEYAVTSVAQALEPFCQSLNVPETPFVLHLPNVLHLASDVTGVLCTSSGTAPSSLSLAAALHPTAAVCGTPTPVANELIREIEGMDRARYAGPVGWMGADGDGEWGIALRSASLDPDDPRRLRLFAGCGVVAASDPASELAETEAKLEPMRHALG